MLGVAAIMPSRVRAGCRMLGWGWSRMAGTSPSVYSRPTWGHHYFHSLGSDLLGGGLPGFSTVQEQTPICGRSGMRWSCSDVNSCNSSVYCSVRGRDGAVEVNLRFQSVLGNWARYLWTPWELRPGVTSNLWDDIIISGVCISDRTLTSWDIFIRKFESESFCHH